MISKAQLEGYIFGDEINELAVCSGACGGVSATKWFCGMRTVCYIEHDPFCVEIIKARIKDRLLDDAPIWDDLTTFNGFPWCGLVDIINASIPCRSFSNARKKDCDNSDQNLWTSCRRVIKQVQPRFVFFENVQGLLGQHGYFLTILADLSSLGYNAEWTVIPASHLGAPHQRPRIWLLAYSNKAHSPSSEESPLRFRPHLGRPTWWDTEPTMARVADGLVHQLDELNATGDGQVPAVAAEAWDWLTR